MNILADAHIPGLLEAFSFPFKLSTYNSPKELALKLKGKDVLFCRSTLKVNVQLLEGSTLQFVATASSGIDHIDQNYLKEKNIKLLSAKGSNARAVADYVVASLAFLQQYKNFKGDKALVVGVGEVGQRVVKRLEAVGFIVSCYDPFQQTLADNHYLTELKHLDQFDLISLHPNLHKDEPFSSFNLFNEAILKQLKPNMALINGSRGNIVDEEALLKIEKPLLYCTDVFNHEPEINPQIIDYATLCTPHIAGHSIEAKLTATNMISEALYSFYGLDASLGKLLPENLPALPANLDWQELVLRLYNPMHESAILKNADSDLAETFLQTRKSHQYRHDFSSYDVSKIASDMKPILGI